ncbi:Histidine kinase-like ATPase domain-containing protein [Marinobacter antarcticus]|uniref:Histidine kinase-like ATPase domain-containing protein n=1 Tax=Marinobacter antarcticus TaxID=564117 RepID=A0A1M6S1T1_9GAMM|nr:SpoIIE family protein phosphatase [Marinobacter antarcticus]SHK38507.1 Histidine kinase-like ATPase domain-containing protein [Marinobacter antarcticus]
MDEPAAESDPLKILIADDSDSDRVILKTLLRHLGHHVLDAANGREAVALFRSGEPDIVLLDALMPAMDGMEAAREIKRLAGERMVPLIFITSLSEAEDLARCLEAGGDGFLSKPYNRVMIDAKINAFNRMRLMHQALSDQRDLMHERNRQLLEEQHVARRVFDNVAHTGCLDSPNIRYHASPLSVFSGDVLFASPRPAGGMLVFTGDFTGHGLPAAIGAMPVAETFYGMASKGFDGSDILREINQKLVRILPKDMFCCGAMVEADFGLNQLKVWNGGLPDGWLVRSSAASYSLPSRHLPLGILNADQFNAEMETIRTLPGDRLLLMTDGVLECSNEEGHLFGERGVRLAVEGVTSGRHPFDALMSGIRRFTGRQKFGDDLTLCCLEMVDHAGLTAMPEGAEPSTLAGPTEWKCVYEIRERTLGEFSPLPLLLHICMEVPGLRRKSGEIYTLLSELYNNALEHGVLELPSEWKYTPEGFDRYYFERALRLSGVSGHYIRFSFHHEPMQWGGRLRVVCEDSGQGFDFQNHAVLQSTEMEQSGPRYAGRGLILLKRLAESIRFHEQGSRVEIVYDWYF